MRYWCFLEGWSVLHFGPVGATLFAQVSEPILGSEIEAIDWLIAGALFCGGVVMSEFVRRAVVGLLGRAARVETMAERLVGRIAQIIILVLALSYALSVLDVRIAPLLGALGISGIAVALALQETLKNLFAGVILHAQRPVRVGDEVETGDMQGMVIDVTSRSVTIRTNSGRTLFVPNSLFLDREIVNLTRHGKRRSSLKVGVAYDTDLESAREVVRAAAASAGGVLSEPPVRVLGSSFGDSSIDFEIDFWHGPREIVGREATSNVLVAVHSALDAAGVTIPFPQRRIWQAHDNNTAGPSQSSQP